MKRIFTGVKTRTPYFVGIAGGSASGKTSFLNALFASFNEGEISIVSQDNYYRPADQQVRDQNGWLNFDLPDSLFREAFHRDLLLLKAGIPVRRQEYTFNNPSKPPGVIEVKPAPIIVTEGLFVFHYDEVWHMLDHKVYLHADEGIRLARRLDRDMRERGYPEHEIRYQWEHHVMPAYRTYLQPFKEKCDLVVNNDDHFQPGLDALVTHLKKTLAL